MKPWLKLCGKGARFCWECVFSFALWSLWLVLALLLAAQAAIALSHELAVPDFLLRALEQRLAASHVHVAFGRATFDPTGAIHVENIRVSLAGQPEPVARVRAALVELDPWSLAVGAFEPRRLHATGVSLSVPAMLSSSGRSEEIISDLDMDCTPRGKEFRLEHLTARVAGIPVSVRGAIYLKPAAGGRAAPLPIAEYLSKNYADLCRRLVRAAARLSVLENPSVEAVLASSETRGAIATLTVRTSALTLADPVALHATGLAATTRIPLMGDRPTFAPVQLQVEALESAGVEVRGLRAQVRGALNPADFSFRLSGADLSAVHVASRGFDLSYPVLRLGTRNLPQVTADLSALFFGLPVSLRGRADLGAQNAALRFDGPISPDILTQVGAILGGRDVRRWVDFGRPVQLNGAAVTFRDGWKFGGLTGHIIAHDINAYGVHMDFARGAIEVDGRHFLASHAKAVLGDNYATGSFEQSFTDRRFRFLLDGQLRPLAISGWFHDWWPDFFGNFEFPRIPDASVDVAGWWGWGYRTTVFVFADSTDPVIRGAKFDHARTLLYIRPNFIDGLELYATHGTGDIRGTFSRTIDIDSGDWAGMDFALNSSIDPAISVPIFGSAASERLAPFHFENSPLLKVSGHFDGPAAAGGEHQRVAIEARSTGAFALHGFPLRNVGFDALVEDDTLTLNRIEGSFADGTLTGRARVWGRDKDRRVGFTGALKDGNLAQAVSVLQRYSAQRKGLPPPAANKFLTDRATVKIDLSASAEGSFDDMLSFKGDGNAMLSGPGLGEVQLLGLLSELLNFTSLRFTSARADFTIDGDRLEFPKVTITGANSAIEAHGTYSLDRQSLDFKARVYPFQESKFFLQNLLGTVLTPLSAALEVKLTGQIDKPAWSFVIGPTNVLRNLFQSTPTENSTGPLRKNPDLTR